MEIYLMRHGVPISHQDWPGGDDSRPLSDIGIDQLEKALTGMKKSGFVPDIILSSPYTRAHQTAEALKTLNPEINVKVVNNLRAGSSIKLILNGVVPYKDFARVLVVGHMPDMALFGSGLTLEADLMERSLEPGEIWAFDVSTFDDGWGGGKLVWEKKLAAWAQ